MLGLNQPPVRETLMPEISRFFGVAITMFYDDHAPTHFHAQYNDNWELARAQAELTRIEPLK